MNHHIPAWLYFSRQERKAMYFLIALLTLQLMVRYIIIPYFKPLPPHQWAEMEIMDHGDSIRGNIIKAYLYDTSITHIKKSKPTMLIEINDADSADLEKLPMIGGFLAQRIVDYRTALGGYYSLDQLLEIKYLKEEVWQSLQHKWKCNGNVHPLLLNEASLEQLSLHPYISYNQAKRIIHYRMQHGAFHSLSELKNTKAIPDTMWERLMPYLALDSTMQNEFNRSN